ncbi:hypothetical protein ES703_31500 [subsurface metagenome]
MDTGGLGGLGFSWSNRFTPDLSGFSNGLIVPTSGSLGVLLLRVNGFCLTLSFCHISFSPCPTMADFFAADHAGTTTPNALLTPKSNHPNNFKIKLSANRRNPTTQIAATNMNVPTDAKWLRRNCAAPMPNTPPEPIGKPKNR